MFVREKCIGLYIYLDETVREGGQIKYSHHPAARKTATSIAWRDSPLASHSGR
jgi:hypothetical protein